MPDMKPVTSSNISAVGYDHEKEELYVQFKGGVTFKYSGVPASAHDSLVNADSIGSHFHKNVRSNYAFAKHED